MESASNKGLDEKLTFVNMSIEPKIVLWGQLGRRHHHADHDVGHQDDCIRWAEPAAAADVFDPRTLQFRIRIS